MAHAAVRLTLESFSLNPDHAMAEINRTDFPYEWAGKAGGRNYECRTLHRFIEERDWVRANELFRKIIHDGAVEAVYEEIFDSVEDAYLELMEYMLAGGINV